MPSQPAETLVPPALLDAWQLEFSIHKPSRLLRRDIELVFRPDLQAEYERHPDGATAGTSLDDFLSSHLLAVPTWQPASLDLSEISDPVNEMRRGLLERFDEWCAAVRPALDPFWSDASCPVEGCAHFGSRTSVIYNELEGLTTLLKYQSVPVGCCGIVLHPSWGRQAYPVTFFTTAPLERLQLAIAAAAQYKSKRA